MCECEGSKIVQGEKLALSNIYQQRPQLISWEVLELGWLFRVGHAFSLGGPGSACPCTPLDQLLGAAYPQGGNNILEGSSLQPRAISSQHS